MSRPLSEFAWRVIVSVLAVPLAVAAAFAGGAPLAALLSIVAAVAAWEFFRIARSAGYDPMEMAGIPLAAAIPLAVHATYLGLVNPPVTQVAMVVVLGLFALSVFARGPNRRPLGATATTCLGVAYSGAMLSFGYALRYHDYAVGRKAGMVLLLFPMLLTWTSDTGAYFVGRALGRHKLIPSVSPNKTVEGALGGLLLAILVSLAYVRWVLAPSALLTLTTQNAVLFGVAVSGAVQLGDLVESMIKREGGVKDSSRIIPGHGGVLDRLDGLIFALPVAYVLLNLAHFLQPALLTAGFLP